MRIKRKTQRLREGRETKKSEEAKGTSREARCTITSSLRQIQYFNIMGKSH